MNEKISNSHLGIEFGSTRIKAVLIDDDLKVIAKGTYEWENKYIDGFWTYTEYDIFTGLKTVYKNLQTDVKEKYNTDITTLSTIGISAMMHGLIALDKKGNMIYPFLTWRNTITQTESEELSTLFNFNIPQRWSITHLYKKIKENDKNLRNIDYLTTLAGYVHYKLTGEKSIGLCDASGIFPLDYETKDYNQNMMAQFDNIIREKNIPFRIKYILPNIKTAGEISGKLTNYGANILDETNTLKEGISFCPPEGDAVTGMISANSVKENSVNISVGTSIFENIVLEKPLTNYYPYVDMVSTVEGYPVAMVHCNNGTTEFDSWVDMFYEFSKEINNDITKKDVYKTLYEKALDTDKLGDNLNMLIYNYISGEHITSFTNGRPIIIKKENSIFNLSSFALSHIFSMFSTMKLATDELVKKENITLNNVTAHGGIFNTKKSAQMILASIMDKKVSVMEDAGEGGAWGIAILASYVCKKDDYESFSDYLDNTVFKNTNVIVEKPDEKIKTLFSNFYESYTKGLDIEKIATEKF